MNSVEPDSKLEVIRAIHGFPSEDQVLTLPLIFTTMETDKGVTTSYTRLISVPPKVTIGLST